MPAPIARKPKKPPSKWQLSGCGVSILLATSVEYGQLSGGRMLPVINQGSSQDEKRLRSLFREMNEQDQSTLLRFAEFLVAAPTQVDNVSQEFPEPGSIERPAEESVVKAIKRLTATYPMINPDALLHRTSDLMAAHIIKGRAASDVIDELELMFSEHYLQLKTQFEQKLTGN